MSWETHLLNESAAVVLEFLAERPRSEEEIAALLAEMLDEKSRGDAPRHSRSVLESLVRLRVIAPVGT